jgi:sigma-B regulation protein RsbU (phosphoserine phosphatase)
MNAKKEEFGQDRLVAIAEKNKNKPIKDIVEIIHKEVKVFEGKLPQHDDITVIVIKIV